MQKRILIGICRGRENYGATALDYPGCVAVGSTIEEVKQRMVEALAMHIEGMLEDGEELPEDVSDFAVIDVPVAVPEKAEA
jgi:predicted RNase H-like HicB family nuclease